MSPRRFAVAHQHKRRGTRLDGSRITWKLNQAATVRLIVQRRSGSAKHAAGCGSARSRVKAKKGNGVVRFRGRFGAQAARAARLPAGGHGHRRGHAKSAAQARDLPGGEGMSGEDDAAPPAALPARARRRSRTTGGPQPATPLDSVHAELVLLREENARLKAAQHRRADIGRLLDRARSLPAAARRRAAAPATRRRSCCRGPRDPRVAAGDLPGDRAGDGRLRGASSTRSAPDRGRRCARRQRRERPSTARQREWLAAPASEPPGAACRVGLVRPRVLLTTEGTYPYAMGGVSSWCDLLVNEPDRVRLAGAADRRPPRPAADCSSCPPHAREVGRDRGVVRGAAARAARPRRSRAASARSCPPSWSRHLLGWEGDTDAVRRRLDLVPAPPRAACAASFRSGRGWAAFLDAPARGARRARARGRHAAGARPRRGRAALPDALLGRAHRGRADAGRPTCCTSPPPAGRRSPRSSTRRCTARRWCSPSTASTCARPTWPRRATATRPARASPRRAWPAASRASAYAGADVVCAGDRRQRLLGDGARHRPGEDPRALQRAAPAGASRRRRRARRPSSRSGASTRSRTSTRMLRVAAETRAPSCPTRASSTTARCRSGEEAYGRSCLALHARLGLGERFRFMGPTADPDGAVRDADVVLMTSISEGLPMSILEAMGQGAAGRRDRRRRRARRRARAAARCARRATTTRWRWPSSCCCATPSSPRRLGPARAPPAEAHLQRVGLHRRLPRPAAGRGRAGRRAARPDRPGGMTAAPLEPADGELIVEARLGRPPQDMLEAAVVLEAWAGVPAQSALAAARELMPRGAARAAAERRAAAGAERRTRPACCPRRGLHRHRHRDRAAGRRRWPRASAATSVERGLMLALPLTLALQWGLRSRYLDRPQGVAQLAGRRRGLLVGAAALVAVPADVLGVAGVLAGLLTVTWTGGTLLVGCRRPLTYALVVLAATPAMIAGVEVMAVLAAVAVATTAAVALALRARAVPARPTPGRWPRAIAARGDRRRPGAHARARPRPWAGPRAPSRRWRCCPRPSPALWGGHHLRHLEQAIPRSVSGIAAGDPYARGVAWPPFSVLLGALGRLLAARRGAVARAARAHAVAGRERARRRPAGRLRPRRAGDAARQPAGGDGPRALGAGRGGVRGGGRGGDPRRRQRSVPRDRPGRRRGAGRRPRAAGRRSASSSARRAPWPPPCGSHERRWPGVSAA